MFEKIKNILNRNNNPVYFSTARRLLIVSFDNKHTWNFVKTPNGATWSNDEGKYFKGVYVDINNDDWYGKFRCCTTYKEYKKVYKKFVNAFKGLD